MPKVQWEDTEHLTRFACSIREFMWNHRPPLNVNQFAEIVGVRSSTVWKWLKNGVIPDAGTIKQIADRTGIHAVVLLEAAGYVEWEDVRDYIVSHVDASGTFSPEEREQFVGHLNELRSVYEARSRDHAQECAEAH